MTTEPATSFPPPRNCVQRRSRCGGRSLQTAILLNATFALWTATAQSQGAFAEEDPFAPSSKSPLSAGSQAEGPRIDEIVIRYKIRNPNFHADALRTATDLDERGKKAIKEGERLVSARDFHSSLTGETTSNEATRARGTATVLSGQQLVAEAAAIRNAVSLRKSELVKLAASPLSEVIELKDLQGRAIRVKILELPPGEFIAQREDDLFFQHPLISLNSDSLKKLEPYRLRAFREQATPLGSVSRQRAQIKLEDDILYYDDKIVVASTPSGETFKVNNDPQDPVNLKAELEREISATMSSIRLSECFLGDEAAFAIRGAIPTEQYPELRKRGRYAYRISFSNRSHILTSNYELVESTLPVTARLYLQPLPAAITVNGERYPYAWGLEDPEIRKRYAREVEELKGHERQLTELIRAFESNEVLFKSIFGSS